jgi:hypothetical protein
MPLDVGVAFVQEASAHVQCESPDGQLFANPPTVADQEQGILVMSVGGPIHTLPGIDCSGSEFNTAPPLAGGPHGKPVTFVAPDVGPLDATNINEDVIEF